MRRAVRRAAGAALIATAAAGGCGSTGGAAADGPTFNIEGNWSAAFTVVSTNGSFVDADCRQLAVGDQLRPTLAIMQDGGTVTVTVVDAGDWAAFRLSGRTDNGEQTFDGSGEM